MTVIPKTLYKHEILRNKKLISKLFSEGKAVKYYPIKLLYLEHSNNITKENQAIFIVPKRNIRKAVDRNKIRRRMKETYRLLKNNIPSLKKVNLDENQLGFIKTNTLTNNISKNFLLLGFIYLAREEVDFSEVEEKIKLCIESIT